MGLGEVEMPSYCPALGRRGSRPAAADLKEAARLLVAAKRPLMVCGSGAVSAGAARPVAALAEALAMPVFTTPGGRGIIAEDAALAFGQVGLYFSEAGKAYWDRADVVLSVGSRLEDFSTGAWHYIPSRARFIQLDVDANAIAMNWRPDVALVGDAALTLTELAAGLRGIDKPAGRRRLDAVGRAKARHQRQVSAEGAGRSRPPRTPPMPHGL